jgi:pheromone shutdown-related protein TraB
MEEKPSAVCVELDEGRGTQILDEDENAWAKLDIIKVFREGKGFMLLANMALSSFQRRMGESMGIKPGMEMKEAILAARELGVPFVYSDREIQITLNRAWRECGWWSKCKLLASLVASAFGTEEFSEEEIESLKQSNELDSMMNDLAEYLPAVKTTLIDERDEFLAGKIWETSVAPPEGVAPGGKVIAVVGAGHLHGIQKHLEELAGGDEKVELDVINTVPPPGALSRALPWLIPVAIVALIAVGFMRNGAMASGGMVLRWILWHGGLAALGSIVALAHPLTVLVAFVGAPIGTLSPVLSIGIFAGICEAMLRRPRVEDAENLLDSITSVKGVYQNRITRALLVFFLASIGGAVGNFISIPTLASQLW